MWEGGIRVPFIVRWPGRLPEGAVYTRPVSQLDVFATIAAACSTPAGKPLDGVDLVPHLTGGNPEPPHDVLYWGFPRAANRWAIRKGRWKLAHEIVDYKPVRPDGVRMETAVYDLEADPGETQNLVAQEAGVAAELGGLKDAWYATLPPSIATAEVRQAWQAELARRKERLPNPDRLRRDGAPGHRLGEGAAVTSPRIESFPRAGLGYRLIDWKQRTDDFLDVVLDPTLTGEYLPLMWWDDTRVHWPHTTFGLPSYVGMKHQRGTFKNAHEAVTTVGTVLSGALVGRDMTRYPVPGSPAPVNLVAMQEAYFSPADGVFLNGIGGKSGGSFWYELLPSILVGGLCGRPRLPHADGLRQMARRAGIPRGMNPHVHDVSRGDGWGVLSGRWGDHDVAGLVGVSRGALSTPKLRGGYGFAMGRLPLPERS